MNALLSAALLLTGWQVASAGSPQSLILLADQRPVLLRVQVELDGQSADLAWKSYLKKWVDFLDRDHDGLLDSGELFGLPRAQVFTALSRNGYYFPTAGQGLTMPELGLPVTSKVGVDELYRYYARNNISGLSAAQSYVNSAMNTQSSTALFKAIDTDKDGFLSKAELEKAAQSLRKFDSDDDELVAQNELPGNATDIYGRVVLPVNGGGMMGMSGGQSQAFLIVPQHGSKASMTARLLARYDRDNDSLLTRAEIGLEQAAFKQLDTNQDDKLDIDELERWLDVAPATTIHVRLGKVSGMELKETGLLQPLKGTSARFMAGNLALQADDAQVSVQLTPTQAMRFGAKQYYLQVFNQVSKNDVVTQNDLQGQQARVLGGLFAVADRNRDGKLTHKELEDFADLVGEAQNQMASVSIGEEGRMLFQVLDANRDGKLSRRELLTAWERLAPLDRNRDGKLSAGEIARQYSLTVVRGSVNYGRGLVVAFPGNQPRPVVSAGRGPGWFQKMDVNGDGEVSDREWLGTPEIFQQIDTNRDGLIDLEEAIRFDQRFRQQQGRK